jgi:DNA-binding transcriptional MocR family regulator
MARNAVLIVAKELLANKRLSMTAKLLLAVLQDHRNNRTGQCNPKRQTLAGELGVSMETITRALKELRLAGFIRAKQAQRTNSYEISGSSNPQALPRQIRNPDPAYPYMNLPKVNKSDGAKRAAASSPPKKPIQSEVLARYYAQYGGK